MANTPSRLAIPIPILNAFPAGQALASSTSSVRVQASYNYYAAQKYISKGFSSTVFNKYATTWFQWRHFYSWPHITPDVDGTEDPINFLQIVLERVYAGLMSAQGKPTKKRLVEQYLRSTVQIFSFVGREGRQTPPQLHGKLDFCLGR